MYEVLIAIDFFVTIFSTIGLLDLYANYIYPLASTNTQQVLVRFGLVFWTIIMFAKFIIVAIHLHKQSRKIVK